MKHRLEMRYPSSWWHDMWREGLAVGNGVTGANLYGGAKREILQLCRHDLWYNGSETEVPDVHKAFYAQREKMDAGNFYEASWEIANALKEKGYASRLEAHLPAAMLTVEQTPIKGFRAFERWLDMEQALACQQWHDGQAVMYREVFVSRKEDMVVYRLRAESEGKREEELSELLDYALELKAYCNEGEPPKEAVKAVWERAEVQAVCEGERVAYLYFHTYRTKSDGTEGGFGAAARISLSEGRLETHGQAIRVKAARQVLITIELYVDEERKAAWRRLHDRLKAQTGSFDEMLSESAAIHGRLYHSAELSLGAENKKDSGRTNEELVMEAFSDKQSAELIEKLWHYGRYLFICGSSPEANPFPLYGLWGGRYQPQWCHNMANENLQMIYWHSLTGNLAEYNLAVFRYMNDRIPAFRKNARRLFGSDGIYMTAGTTPGVSSPTQVVPVIINWVGAAGWIAQHYYRYFLYTRDMEYARKVMLPYMDGVAAFYEEFVRFTSDDSGGERIKLYPSVSPENTPLNFMPPDGRQMAHPMPTTINSTIDLAIYKEFFTNMLAIAEMWKELFPQERVDRWRRILNSIPEYKTNRDDAIKEWQEDCFADRYEHRHLSHIYPVFPGYELYPGEEPERAAVYEKAVRLRKIDAQTGWSMAHMAAIYARLRDGEAAMECLDNMARSCLLNNFFTLHNDWRGMNISLAMDPAPVQLDAIMGYVNAVQEMILYAAPGYIALLPAPEERLSVGKIKDFRYSDGLIHMRWNRRENTFACEITPLRAHRVRILLPDFAKQATVRHDAAVKVSGPECGRIDAEFLSSEEMPLYIIL